MRQLGTPFDEISPFGSSERHVLRHQPRHLSERAPGRQHRRPRHADYQTLPFIVREPYLESLADHGQASPEASQVVMSSSRSRLEPGADFRLRHQRLDAAR